MKIIKKINNNVALGLDGNGTEIVIMGKGIGFTIHMRYLMMRRKSKTEAPSDNRLLYDLMRAKYPDTYTCMLEIDKYLKQNMKWKLNEEELLYLMLHINRLCAK